MNLITRKYAEIKTLSIHQTVLSVLFSCHADRCVRGTPLSFLKYGKSFKDVAKLLDKYINSACCKPPPKYPCSTSI